MLFLLGGQRNLGLFFRVGVVAFFFVLVGFVFVGLGWWIGRLVFLRFFLGDIEFGEIQGDAGCPGSEPLTFGHTIFHGVVRRLLLGEPMQHLGIFVAARRDIAGLHVRHHHDGLANCQRRKNC